MPNKYNTFIFLKQQYPKVESSLKNKKNSDDLQTYIRKYIDRNSEILFDKAPSKRLFFKEQDINIAYQTTGTNPTDIANLIKENKLTESSWQIFNKPFNWCMAMTLRYYYVNKKEKEMQACLMYLTLSLFSSLHFKYFPYVPNENIMTFTVNNLNNKYYIKQFGILFKALFETAVNCHQTYADYLKISSDRHLIEYIMNLRTRLNSFMQNIADEYYKNQQSGNYLNYEKDNDDPDNYYETDNISFLINKMADNCTTMLLTHGVDLKLCNLSAQICEVSRTSVKSALDSIIKNENRDIREIIILILQQYLVVEKHNPQTIGTKEFISVCMSVYSKSNTIDENVLRIKDILDKWLNDNSEKYTKTERVATKSNFRKAIFLFFVFTIQQNYVNH